MSAPSAYFPAYNFTQFQTSHPSTPLPAASLDAELFDISISITEIVQALAMIQRADGALANGSVGIEQLQTSLFIGVNIAANWLTATSYVAGNSVYQSNNVYLCIKSHTSSVFATDLANGNWQLVLNFNQFVSAASASATAAGVSAAAAAVSAASLTSTSATAVTIGSGAQTFTTQAGKYFSAGAYVSIVSNANPTVNYMNAQVTTYSGTSLVVNVTAFGGSGSHTDWTINVSGAPGATGATGAPGAGTGDMLKANNLSELANFATARTNLGLGSSAVQAVSFFAQAANNLSDVANAATAFGNIKQAGTSGATGVLQLATNAEAISGADTAKAVTAAGVAAAISAHIPVANIYQAFPADAVNIVPGSSQGTGNMLGYAAPFTPASSNKVKVTIVGVNEGDAGITSFFQVNYGTGSAPAQGSGPVGSAVGNISKTYMATTGNKGGVFICSFITSALVLSTTYWFDVNVWNANISQTINARNVSITIEEVK